MSQTAEELRRTIVVTGATGGIGSAVCRRMARDGYLVFCVDVSKESLDNLVISLPGRGHVAYAADLRDIEQHDEIFERAARGRQLVGLAHLAAVLRRRSSIEDISEEDWDYQLDTNLKATFFLDRAAARVLERTGGGSIVNVVSQGWWTGGFGGSVVYAASKGGVVSMSRGLARSLAPLGIRVNTLAPGFVDTSMMRGGLTPEQLQAQIEQVPIGRLAEPEEIADALAFLLSPDARYITGATLNVTGGQLMY